MNILKHYTNLEFVQVSKGEDYHLSVSAASNYAKYFRNKFLDGYEHKLGFKIVDWNYKKIMDNKYSDKLLRMNTYQTRKNNGTLPKRRKKRKRRG